MAERRRVLALCGGVGGAKLALGLSHILPSRGALTVVVNTGDDFDHLGLRICPDIDTVTYTLAGIVNTETGWGRAQETGNFMASLSALGGEDWFYLGDKDLALHVERTRLLNAGVKLDVVTRRVATKLGITARILPMSNDRVETMVETTTGTLAFQHYFVRERCQPQVTSFHFAGIDHFVGIDHFADIDKVKAPAKPHAELMAALLGDELDAVIICPSNPFVSVDPILALPGVRDALRACSAPVIAISPIVGGAAVKGPTAKMMRELGLQCTPTAVVNHYQDFLDGFILDQRDVANRDCIAGRVTHLQVADTLMLNLDRKIALARLTLDFARQCRRA